MPDEHPARRARQPFTVGGVARFAHATLGRVLLVALFFGIISGLVMSWLASTCWAPVVDEAVSALPPTGTIEAGNLHWPEKTRRLLAANAFISIEVGLDGYGTDSPPVDFAFEFKTNRVVVRSILGTRSLPYTSGLDIELNRTALFPTWGAWKAPILFTLIPGTAFLLMICWSLLAVPYSLLPLVIGGIFNRDIGPREAWKLCVAAQLPGSLLMAFAIGLYSTGQISMLFVLAMLPIHLVPTVIYLFISPFFVRKRVTKGSSKENPFQPEGKRSSTAKNPFAGK